MLQRFAAVLGLAFIAGCGGSVSESSSPNPPLVPPPNAVFEMRGGGRTAGVGGYLTVSVPRGEMASITLDASPSTAPSSAIASYSWRVNGSSAGSAATLTVSMAPNATAYQVELQVTNAAGKTAAAGGTIAINEIIPRPTITTIAPAALVVSPNPQVVVITGTDFSPSGVLAVTLPGENEPVAVPLRQFDVTPTTITAALGFARVGQYTLQVASSTGDLSNKIGLLVSAAPLPAPRIASISPASLTARRQPQTISIVGSGFRPGLSVTLFAPNGSTLNPNPVSLSDSTGVSFSANLNGIIGSWNVEVKNPDGQSSNRAQFFAGDPAPNIASIVPTTIQASASPQNLTISGSNFDASATVTLTDLATGAVFANHPVASRSAGQIIVARVFSAAATWSVRVVNTDGSASALLFFQVVGAPPANPPSILAISPATVSALSAQAITISGRNFVSGAVVSIREPVSGQTVTPQIRQVSPDVIDLTVTFPNVGGAWLVKVTNPDGRASSEGTIQVLTSPTITGPSPAPIVVDVISQRVKFVGTDLTTVDVITLTSPTGRFSAPVPKNATATSFEIDALFNEAGTWSITGMMLDRRRTPPVAFQVVAGIPTITSFQPVPMYTAPQEQSVLAIGTRIDIDATLRLRGPSGQIVDASIGFRQVNRLYGNALIGQAGAWTAEAVNPDGATSARVPFQVLAGSAPTVLSVKTPVLTASANRQNVVIDAGGAGPFAALLYPPNGASPVVLEPYTPGSNIAINSVFNVVGTWSIRLYAQGWGYSTPATFQVVP